MVMKGDSVIIAVDSPLVDSHFLPVFFLIFYLDNYVLAASISFSTMSFLNFFFSRVDFCFDITFCS